MFNKNRKTGDRFLWRVLSFAIVFAMVFGSIDFGASGFAAVVYSDDDIANGYVYSDDSVSDGYVYSDDDVVDHTVYSDSSVSGESIAFDDFELGYDEPDDEDTFLSETYGSEFVLHYSFDGMSSVLVSNIFAMYGISENFSDVQNVFVMGDDGNIGTSGALSIEHIYADDGSVCDYRLTATGLFDRVVLLVTSSDGTYVLVLSNAIVIGDELAVPEEHSFDLDDIDAGASEEIDNTVFTDGSDMVSGTPADTSFEVPVMSDPVESVPEFDDGGVSQDLDLDVDEPAILDDFEYIYDCDGVSEVAVSDIIAQCLLSFGIEDVETVLVPDGDGDFISVLFDGEDYRVYINRSFENVHLIIFTAAGSYTVLLENGREAPVEPVVDVDEGNDSEAGDLVDDLVDKGASEMVPGDETLEVSDENVVSQDFSGDEGDNDVTDDVSDEDEGSESSDEVSDEGTVSGNETSDLQSDGDVDPQVVDSDSEFVTDPEDGGPSDDEDNSSDETQVVPVSYPEQHFEGSTAYVRVSVDAPEGAFPDGTTMVVSPVSGDNALSDIEDAVADDFTAVSDVYAVDIAFFNPAGEEIEPLVPISVSMSVISTGDDQSAVVVHVDDEGAVEVVDNAFVSVDGDGRVDMNIEVPASENAFVAVSDVDVENLQSTDVSVGDPEEDTGAGSEPVSEDVLEEVEGTTVEASFDAEVFSTYAIVLTEAITVRYMDASGATYSVELGYDKASGVTSDCDLVVSEVVGDDADSYFRQAAEVLNADADRVLYAKAFNISILKDGSVFQPDGPVSLSVRLLDNPSEDEDMNVVHFGEVAEALDCTVEGNAVAFESSGFSVYVFIQYDTDVSNINIMDGDIDTSLDGMSVAIASKGYFLSIVSDTLKAVSMPSKIIFWTFTFDEEAEGYRISNAGRYLSVSGSALSYVASEEDASLFHVVDNGSAHTLRDIATGRYIGFASNAFVTRTAMQSDRDVLLVSNVDVSGEYALIVKDKNGAYGAMMSGESRARAGARAVLQMDTTDFSFDWTSVPPTVDVLGGEMPTLWTIEKVPSESATDDLTRCFGHYVGYDGRYLSVGQVSGKWGLPYSNTPFVFYVMPRQAGGYRFASAAGYAFDLGNNNIHESGYGRIGSWKEGDSLPVENEWFYLVTPENHTAVFRYVMEQDPMDEGTLFTDFGEEVSERVYLGNYGLRLPEVMSYFSLVENGTVLNRYDFAGWVVDETVYLLSDLDENGMIDLSGIEPNEDGEIIARSLWLLNEEGSVELPEDIEPRYISRDGWYFNIINGALSASTDVAVGCNPFTATLWSFDGAFTPDGKAGYRLHNGDDYIGINEDSSWFVTDADHAAAFSVDRDEDSDVDVCRIHSADSYIGLSGNNTYTVVQSEGSSGVDLVLTPDVDYSGNYIVRLAGGTNAGVTVLEQSQDGNHFGARLYELDEDGRPVIADGVPAPTVWLIAKADASEMLPRYTIIDTATGKYVAPSASGLSMSTEVQYVCIDVHQNGSVRFVGADGASLSFSGNMETGFGAGVSNNENGWFSLLEAIRVCYVYVPAEDDTGTQIGFPENSVEIVYSPHYVVKSPGTESYHSEYEDLDEGALVSYDFTEWQSGGQSYNPGDFVDLTGMGMIFESVWTIGETRDRPEAMDRYVSNNGWYLNAGNTSISSSVTITSACNPRSATFWHFEGAFTAAGTDGYRISCGNNRYIGIAADGKWTIGSKANALVFEVESLGDSAAPDVNRIYSGDYYIGRSVANTFVSAMVLDPEDDATCLVLTPDTDFTGSYVIYIDFYGQACAVMEEDCAGNNRANRRKAKAFDFTGSGDTLGLNVDAGVFPSVWIIEKVGGASAGDDEGDEGDGSVGIDGFMEPAGSRLGYTIKSALTGQYLALDPNNDNKEGFVMRDDPKVFYISERADGCLRFVDGATGRAVNLNDFKPVNGFYGRAQNNSYEWLRLLKARYIHYDYPLKDPVEGVNYLNVPSAEDEIAFSDNYNLKDRYNYKYYYDDTEDPTVRYEYVFDHWTLLGVEDSVYDSDEAFDFSSVDATDGRLVFSAVWDGPDTVARPFVVQYDIVRGTFPSNVADVNSGELPELDGPVLEDVDAVDATTYAVRDLKDRCYYIYTNSDNRFTWYTMLFKWWEAEDGSRLQPGDVIDLVNGVDRFDADHDGYIHLKSVWCGTWKDGTGLPSAKFSIFLETDVVEGDIIDNRIMSENVGKYSKGSLCGAIMYAVDDDGNIIYPDEISSPATSRGGHSNYGLYADPNIPVLYNMAPAGKYMMISYAEETANGETVVETDAKVRGLATEGYVGPPTRTGNVYHWKLTKVPTDDEVFANLRERAIQFTDDEGKAIPFSELNSKNYTIRWCQVKYQSGTADGWNINGKLTRNESYTVISKTFYGEDEAIQAAIDQGFNITLTDEYGTVTTLRLVDKTSEYSANGTKAAKIDANTYGYGIVSTDPVDGSTTYTWTVVNNGDRVYSIKENNYNVTLDNGHVYGISVQYSQSEPDGSEGPKNPWNSNTVVRVFANASDILNDDAIVTTNFYNTYLPEGTLLINVKNDRGPLANTRLKLYDASGNPVRLSYNESQAMYNTLYESDGTTDVIVTNSRGEALIKFDHDEGMTSDMVYTIRETVPFGHVGYDWGESFTPSFRVTIRSNGDFIVDDGENSLPLLDAWGRIENVFEQGAKSGSVNITNHRQVEVTIRKNVVGLDGDTSGRYNFDVSLSDGDVQIPTDRIWRNEPDRQENGVCRFTIGNEESKTITVPVSTVVTIEEELVQGDCYLVEQSTLSNATDLDMTSERVFSFRVKDTDAVTFTNTRIICKVVDRKYEHTFGSIKDAVYYIRTRMSKKKGTIEMLVDYVKPASDVVEIMTGYDITLTTARQKAGMYYWYTGEGNAVITRGAGYDDASLMSVQGTNIEGKLTLKDISFNGGDVDASCDGSFVKVVHGGNLVVDNGVVMEEGSTTGNGGAIFVENGGKAHLKGDVRISECSADTGGGVYTEGELRVSNAELVISDNTATVGGGIAVGGNGNLTVSGGLIGGSEHGNTAVYGAGIHVGENARVVFSGGTVSHNHASAKVGYDGDASGAGIYAAGTLSVSNDGTIIDNTSDKFGGAVYVSETGSMTLSGGEISGNTVSEDGEGAGVCLAEGAELRLSGGPDFGSGNLVLGTVSDKTNGCEEYTRLRQDICVKGFDDSTAPSITVTGLITSGEGSIWVWCESEDHHRMLTQFAVAGQGVTLSERTLHAFRNACDDEMTGCNGVYLTGQTGSDVTVGGTSMKGLYWTGGFDFVFMKIDSYGNGLDGAEFMLYKPDAGGSGPGEVYRVSGEDVKAVSGAGTASDPQAGTDASHPVSVHEKGGTPSEPISVEHGVYGDNLVVFDKVPPGAYFLVETVCPAIEGLVSTARWLPIYASYKVVVDAKGWYDIYAPVVGLNGTLSWPDDDEHKVSFRTTHFGSGSDAYMFDIPLVMDVSSAERKVIVRKVDDGTVGLKYSALEGAMFTVYRADRSTVAFCERKNNTGDTVQVPLKDISSNDTGAYFIGRLPYGRYYVVETAVASSEYKMPEHWFVLEISDDGVREFSESTSADDLLD